MTQEEINKLEKKAIEQFMDGKSLFGKGGAFAPMLKNFIEKALQAEMEEHLGEEERRAGNKRNGKGKKTIKSSQGTFDIETPRTATAALSRTWSRNASVSWQTTYRKRSSGFTALG